MHGFMNVFLAAAFLRAGMEAKLAVQVLAEQSAQAFHFDADGAGWRQYRLSRNEIATARLLELTSRGRDPVTLPTGEQRKFLEDGDEVVLSGLCERDGFRRIGLGSCRGTILPASAT